MKKLLSVAALILLFSAIGSASAVDSLVLTIKSSTSTSVTLGWTPPADAAGYKFIADGAQVGTSLVGTKSQYKFTRAACDGQTGCYQVQVLTVTSVGSSTGQAAPPPPPPPAACADGLDNDGDGLIDYPNDPGCSSATDTDETDAPPPPPPPSGYPDASNTGVPTGTTLTAYTGPSNITTANTVIDGKTMGCIQISAPGVVIRNSKISCGSGYAVYIDDRTSNQTLLTIEDSEVTCTGNGGTGIGEADVTVRRVEITKCENGFDINQNITVEDSFIHDLYNSSQAHADGIQLAGGYWNGTGWEGNGARNVTIRHNTIYGMGYPNDSTFGTSAIISNPTGDINITIDNNLLAGGAATVYCDRPGSGTNYNITNNKFSTRFGPNVGAYYPMEDCGNETTHSGNVYYETGLPVPLN